jgi:hypothetical protein
MNRESRTPTVTAAVAAVLLVGLLGSSSRRLYAKHKPEEMSANDPTLRLFQLLDSSRDGKLPDFYLLADLYKDPNKADQELRHVLRVDYDKNRGFGKLNLWVRSVGQMTQQQLQTYSPKQIYDFAETDQEKYVKTNPGSFGAPGDLYLRASDDGPLASAPITDEVRKSYEVFVTQYLLPAVQKK